MKKKRRYKIRFYNITLILFIIFLIITINDFTNIMDLILYNPQHKGLTVIIKLIIDMLITFKTLFYTIEKKTF